MKNLKLTATCTASGFIEEATVTGQHSEYTTPEAFRDALYAYAAGLEAIGIDVSYPAERTASRAFKRYRAIWESMN